MMYLADCLFTQLILSWSYKIIVISAQAEFRINLLIYWKYWIPAFGGMTDKNTCPAYMSVIKPTWHPRSCRI